VSLFLPSFGRFVVLLITLGVAALCVGLGQLVGARRPAVALVAGWGLACIVFVVTGGLFGGAFTTVVVPLGVAGVVGLGLLTRGTFHEGSWASTVRVLVLATPFLVIAAATGPVGVDEFTHWLPNLDFLYRHDRFPSRDMPSLISERPSIPYAMAFVGYVVSLILGRVAETAGIVWNALLLVAVGALCADIVAEQVRTRAGVGGRAQDLTAAEEWGMAGIGLLAATMLNPSFVPRLFLSNDDDGPVGSVTAIATAAVVLWLSAETGRTRNERLLLVVAIGFCCAALAELRQDGLTLFALVFIAAVAATPVERQVGRRVTPGMLLLILPPALLVALVWREYQVVQIPDEALAMLGPSQWHWAVLGATAWSMAQVALAKIGYFALLGLLIGFAVAVGDAPHYFTPFQRTGVLMGAVLGVGKIVWLLLMYLVASYTEQEAAQAKDFFRFMVQVGPALVVAAIPLIPTRLWALQPAGALLCFAAPILAVVLPIVSVRYLRVDAGHATHALYLRGVGRDIVGLIGAAPRVTLVDPDDAAGDLGNLAIVRYQLQGLGERRPRHDFWPPLPDVSFIAGQPPIHLLAESGTPRDAAIGYPADWRDPDIAKQLAAPFVWFQDGGPVASQLAGMKLAQGASYLLAHRDSGAELVRTWPHPAGE
jgi:hypothetical protein